MAVYLIQAGNQPIVKIGKANCPVTRMYEHQCAHWEELKLLRTWSGDLLEEAMLHEKFSDLRIRGEWFVFSKAMLEDVGLVVIGAPAKKINPETQEPGGQRKKMSAERRAKYSAAQVAFNADPEKKAAALANRRINNGSLNKRYRLDQIVSKCGGFTRLSAIVGLSTVEVCRWTEIPLQFVATVCAYSGLSEAQVRQEPCATATPTP